MSARASAGAANVAPMAQEPRHWIESPFGRDLAELVGWDSVFVVPFYVALVWSTLGEAALVSYLFTIPAAIALVTLVTPFTVLPIMSARRVSVEPSGLAIVRFREVETYPWSGVKVGFRPPRAFPFIGRRYPISLTGGHYPGRQTAFLNRAQAEALASHRGGSVEEIWLPRNCAKGSSGDDGPSRP